MIVPIVSDSIIPANGALHCVSKGVPVGKLEKMQGDPGAQCGAYAAVCPKPTGCGDVTEDGYCSEYEVNYCGDDGKTYYIQCHADCNQVDPGEPCEEQCSEEGGFAHCVDVSLCNQPGACTEECTPGEVGCTSTNESWMCGLAMDGDICYEKVAFTCLSGFSCGTDYCSASTPCGDITTTGTCEGNILKKCINNTLKVQDCSVGGLVCKIDGIADCVDEKCANPCVIEEKGCNDELNARWVCTLADNGCLTKVLTECDTGEYCASGKCVKKTCSDQCSPDESGCSTDQKQSWICKAPDNPGACYTKVSTDCPNQETCSAETHLCTKACTDACNTDEKGCDESDTRRFWTCGDENGDGCREKVYDVCKAGEVCHAGTCLQKITDDADTSTDASGDASGGGGGGCTVSSPSARERPIPFLFFCMTAVVFFLRVRKSRKAKSC
jgi:hypothetical protein